MEPKTEIVVTFKAGASVFRPAYINARAALEGIKDQTKGGYAATDVEERERKTFNDAAFPELR